LNNSNLDGSDSAGSLWFEKYTPKSENDLAATPSKVQNVKSWITNALRTNTKDGHKLLVISGPSGCGKSTTIRTLATTLDFDIQEWSPFGPTRKWSDLDDKQDHESLMTNFIEYLTRSLRHDRTFQNTTNIFERKRRKVILIDDIPDLSNGNSRRRFHDFMRGICRNTETHVPVILTLTTIEETRGYEPRNGVKRRTYDFAERGVIPTDIIESRFCTRIHRYSAVTTKKMTKVLSSIYKSEALEVPIDFKAIIAASNGDVRSAINNLQFYAIPKQHPDHGGHLQTSAFGRETSLDMFHAIGKVLYAKRTPKGALESNPEDILATMCIDEQAFVLWLHQNYAPFMDDMESCANAVDWLSLANHLASFGEGYMGAEYESLLAVRGMMYSRKLPAKYNPVKKPEYWDYMNMKNAKVTTQSSSSMFAHNLILHAKSSEEDDDQDIVDTWTDEEVDDDMWGDLDDDLLAALPDSQNIEPNI